MAEAWRLKSPTEDRMRFPQATLVDRGVPRVNETPKISHQSTVTQAQKPNRTHVLTQAQKPTHAHELAKKPTTHENEKIALVLALAGGFAIWNIFQ